MSGRVVGRGGFAAESTSAIGERGTYVALALLTLAALALRLFRIDAASYWADELFSVFWVRESLGFLWSAEAFEIETTPPLYYTLLKPWAAAFGSSELAIRSFSAVLSAATVPLVWRLAREFTGPGTALLAAAIFALNPMQMQFAQEARAYALIPPLYILALLGLVRFCRAAPARRDGALALYGIAALGLVYTHATSAFTLAALNLCAGFWLLRGRAGWPPLLRLAVVDAAVVVLAIPEILAILAQTGRYDIAWIEKPDLVALFNLANTLVVDPIFALRFRIASIISTIVLALLALVLWQARPGRLAWVFLAAPAVLFLAMTLGMSLVASPFFIARIAIFVAVPLAILAAMALVSARPPIWLRGGFALALLVATGLGLQGILTVTPQIKENWRGLGAALGPQLGAGDVVAIGPRTNMLGLGYYLDGLRQERWQPDGAPLIPLAPFAPEGMPEAVRVPDAQIAAWVGQGRRVWLVLNPRDGDLLTQQAMGLVPGRVPRLDRSHAMLTVLVWDGAH
ncbi:glycosyltransferase family 39 protein [Dankookia sp. GCM10030260]|uniref:glycosyltransferase family 39 protein n=1 Tax=Dankookia sp. GCM10030260 TaxID=3273390 RepID=UPI0036153C1C